MRNVVEVFWVLGKSDIFLKVPSHYDMSNEIRTFQCNQCDIIFVVEDTLTSDMHEIHLEDEATQSM